MIFRMAAPILLMLAFIMATRLDGWSRDRAERGHRSGSMLEILMGDSRRLFANQFFVKADVYFHSGYYPSIFDNQSAFKTPHIAADSGAAEERNTGEEADALGPPLDWIDRFSRRFFPSVHTHMGASGPEALVAGDAVPKGGPGQEREMMPWLRLSVALDPQHVQSYVVAAYWLRDRLHATAEAENFLREGLRANPDSYELLFEMGRIAQESRGDDVRARTLWRAGVEKWHATEDHKAEPDYFGLRQLLAYLALAEEHTGNYRESLAHLTEADAIPGGQGLYQQRLQRTQALLDGKETASGAIQRSPPPPP